MKLINTIVVTGLLLALLTGCAEKSLKQQREEAARAATVNTPIRIGFVWPFSAEYDLLPEGVYMAVDEINSERVVCDPVETITDTGSPAQAITSEPETTASVDTTAEPEAATPTELTVPAARNCRLEHGLLGGRKIELVERDDQDLVREGRLIAQEFAENVDITAVIGHAWSYISVPAAPLYEFNGLIMLSPSATSPELTDKGYQYIFRNVLSDNEVGRQLAVYATRQGYTRVAILYSDGAYGRQLSNVFENVSSPLGITIVDRRPYQGTRNFQPILAEWETLEFDAIFIAGSNPEAAEFIRDARRRGINQPIIGSDGLDTADLWNIAGEAALGVVVASFYAPDNPDSELQGFIIRFQQKYNTIPDTWAAQGYDAVWLLADAIFRAGSTVPSEVAQKLHETHGWQGITGTHTFDAAGDVIGKPLVLKVQDRDGLKFLQLASTEQE